MVIGWVIKNVFDSGAVLLGLLPDGFTKAFERALIPCFEQADPANIRPPAKIIEERRPNLKPDPLS